MPVSSASWQFGAWAILPMDGGRLIACACGEFGGFAQWHDPRDRLLQVLVADTVQTLIGDDRVLLCITGITHLQISEGAIHAFRREGERWVPLGRTELPSQADRIEVAADGSLVLQLHREGVTMRYAEGQLSWLDRAGPAEAPARR